MARVSIHYHPTCGDVETTAGAAAGTPLDLKRIPEPSRHGAFTAGLAARQPRDACRIWDAAGEFAT